MKYIILKWAVLHSEYVSLYFVTDNVLLNFKSMNFTPYRVFKDCGIFKYKIGVLLPLLQWQDQFMQLLMTDCD